MLSTDSLLATLSSLCSDGFKHGHKHKIHKYSTGWYVIQHLLPFFLTSGLAFFIFTYADTTACESEERLFHKLFSQYNQFIRPVENVSDPVTVYFELAITQLTNVVRPATEYC